MKNFLLSIFFIFSAVISFAGGGIVGQWKGVISLGENKLRVVAAFEESDSGLAGTFYSLDQGAQGMSMDKISVKDGKVYFQLAALNASFNGKLDGDKIDGIFSQSGVSMELVLSKDANPTVLKGTSFTLPADKFKVLKGEWNGVLEVTSMTKLRLNLIFSGDSPDKCGVCLVSPDQSQEKIRASKVESKKSETKLEFASIGALIDFKIADGKLYAKFNQGALTQKVVFKKSAK